MPDNKPPFTKNSNRLLSAEPGSGAEYDRPVSDVRILLVEDNTTNQLVAQKMLEKLGYGCCVVVNGLEALAALRESRYDLMLMDCQMPELDGFSATRRIRSGESGCSNRQVPIIAMTAFAMTGDRERCLAAGMNDYLSKPVQLRQLADILGRWLPWRPAVPTASAGSGAAPSTAQEAPRVFDRESFLDRLMGDEAVARTICDGFIADMPVQISRLATAVRNGDRAQVVRDAHRIKGAAANVGGIALQAAALAIETAAQAGALVATDQVLEELEHCFARLRYEMLAHFFPELSEN